MEKILKTFSTDNLIGKLCLLGFLAPIVAVLIRFYISEKANGNFYILKVYNSSELWLYLVSVIWFFIALFRGSLSERCPKCSSVNNSKVGRTEVERYEGKETETIEVDRNVLTGAGNYESYDVPTTFIKTAFSFKCHNCQHSWEKIIDIAED